MNKLSPLIKWTGGKRREIKIFEQYIPEFIRYIEPFIGGGALYFHLNSPNSIINDMDYDLINFYRTVKGDADDFIKELDVLKGINGDHDAMEKMYYIMRGKEVDSLSDIERALRFSYVNQLSFSGMRRFNKDGKFNVPFGHYKNFSLNITKGHIDLIKSTKIYNIDANNVIIDNDMSGSFMFIDPPYTRVFKQYTHDNTFGQEDQIILAKNLTGLFDAKFMLVINDDPFIRDLYKGCRVESYDLSYGVNIKNRFNTSVKHLVIMNY